MLTPEDVLFLDGATDRVVAIELNTGEQFFAEVVMVVDQPPTPDVFLLRVEREADGSFVATSTTGESVLLSDIARVAALPGVQQ